MTPTGRPHCRPARACAPAALLLAAASLTLCAGAGYASAARAADYPSRPVKIVVPFAAGGPADIFARYIGAKLQARLGQNFVIEDRPGGGSVIGTDAVAKSAPDGYTLLMMSNTHTVNESLMKTKPFALMRDFVPVAPVNYSDLVLVVHPSVKANNVGELLALARAKPGALNYASSGPGTPYHMAGELFKALAKVDIVHVPYKGSSGARVDVIGGQVQMMFDAVPTQTGNIAAGKVRALATSGRQRSAILNNLPTVAEGGVPGYEAVIWLGLMAPRGTPPDVVARLNAEVGRIVSAPETRKEWLAKGATPMAMSTAEFEQYLRDDIAKWAKVVEISGAKVGQ